MRKGWWILDGLLTGLQYKYVSRYYIVAPQRTPTEYHKLITAFVLFWKSEGVF